MSYLWTVLGFSLETYLGVILDLSLLRLSLLFYGLSLGVYSILSSVFSLLLSMCSLSGCKVIDNGMSSSINYLVGGGPMGTMPIHPPSVSIYSA